MRISGISYPDVNNGLGFRVVIWVQGCSHHCKGCHNKCTWDFNGGREFNDKDKELVFDLLSKDYIKGITFSGGDPLDSIDGVLPLAMDIKNKFPSKDIWLYSGYTIDEIKNSDKKKILDFIDVLVDGEYVERLRDVSLAFRGSSNQNIWENNGDGTFTKSKLN